MRVEVVLLQLFDSQQCRQQRRHGSLLLVQWYPGKRGGGFLTYQCRPTCNTGLQTGRGGQEQVQGRGLKSCKQTGGPGQLGSGAGCH